MSSETPPDPADRVAEIVLAVPGVSSLHAGVLQEVATYLPGRRVNGVRLRGDACEVHVVLDWGTPILETAAHLRAALEPIVKRAVHVTVEDLASPSDDATHLNASDIAY